MSASVFVVTANRLRDGRPVYLTADRRWSERLGEAETVRAAKDVEAPLAWAKTEEREVCDPYSMKAELVGGRATPSTTRERIRAAGPTWIRERFGYRV